LDFITSENGSVIGAGRDDVGHAIAMALTRDGFAAERYVKLFVMLTRIFALGEL
jgi:hypothetical protein